MMQSSIYSSSPNGEVPVVEWAFPKEQSYWCAAAGPVPHGAGNEVMLICVDQDRVDETEFLKIFIEGQAFPQISIDKKTQRALSFQKLVSEWKQQRGSRSSITQAATMEPYQKIIGMGEDAIPLLLAQMKSEGDNPDQWFWALRAISHENPVPPDDRGNFRKMAQAWFGWGERNGYAW